MLKNTQGCDEYSAKAHIKNQEGVAVLHSIFFLPSHSCSLVNTVLIIVELR